MKKVAFLLIVTFLVFACAMFQSYDDTLQKWVGRSETSLLESWGTPTGQKVMANDEKILTYTKQESWYVPTEYYYDMPGWNEIDVVYDPFFDDFSMSPYAQVVDTEVFGICQTSFYIKNGIVTSYKWRGNGC